MVHEGAVELPRATRSVKDDQLQRVPLGLPRNVCGQVSGCFDVADCLRCLVTLQSAGLLFFSAAVLQMV